MNSLYTISYKGAFIHATTYDTFTRLVIEVFRIQMSDGSQYPAKTFLGAKRKITKLNKALK